MERKAYNSSIYIRWLNVQIESVLEMFSQDSKLCFCEINHGLMCEIFTWVSGYVESWKKELLLPGQQYRCGLSSNLGKLNAIKWCAKQWAAFSPWSFPSLRGTNPLCAANTVDHQSTGWFWKGSWPFLTICIIRLSIKAPYSEIFK